MIVRKKWDSRLDWFRELRFGMMVHFGLYALLGRHEWVMLRENILREDYEKLMTRFNPHRFDADEWVAVAKNAGARYINVTAKHHDGFCLFDSELTDFKITNTPFGRDLIGELIDACHRGGLRICLFYSQPDWHHPCFVHREGHWKELQYKRPGDTPDWPAYLRYYQGQVKELCTKYGRIDGIWFDGSHRREPDWRGRDVYRMIKKHQPHAVVNDRAGYGDYFTPERRLSGEAAADGYMVEAIQSIDTWSWGYSPGSALHTSPVLLRSLLTMASVGGNFLLNVGPKPDGSIPSEQVRRLRDIGKWLETRGHSVFGTQGCCRRHESKEKLYTRAGRTVYLHLLEWPQRDELVLKKLKRVPTSARLLKSGARLDARYTKDGVVLDGLPSLPPDPCANVVEMTFDSDDMFAPIPKPLPARVFELKSTRPLELPLSGATCRGYAFKGSPLTVAVDEPLPDEDVFWKTPEQKASWKVRTDRAATCRVFVDMACKSLYAGSTFELRAGRSVLRGVVPPTGSYSRCRRVALGVLRLPKGVTTLTLAPKKQNYGYIFANVRRLTLRPEAGRRERKGER